MYLKTVGLISLCAFIMVSCSSDNQANHPSAIDEAAYIHCDNLGGVVENVMDENGISQEICVYQETAEFDIGTQVYTHRCELTTLYEDHCDDEAEINEPVLTINEENQTSIKTWNDAFYSKADEILKRVKNTGYAHNAYDNFSLIPDVDKVFENNNTVYNIFLDCSGFIGYYIVQGLNTNLYNKVSRSYMCGSFKDARPLAADFVDTFKNVPYVCPTDTNHTISKESNKTCWRRVDHISNALPGDIIVYYHESHIDRTPRCCYEDNVTHSYVIEDDITERECLAKENGRINYKINGNSGHILMIMQTPKRAQNTYDDNGNLQWIVHVADSTTSNHSYDSRKVGENESIYKGNTYHAWSAKEPYVYRCADGSYHRDCSQYDSYCIENIHIDTAYIDDYKEHPTGTGAGVMYVNNNMKGYRTRTAADIDDAEILIGRPVECTE